MKDTIQLVDEICAYVLEHGEYPPRGYLSKSGKDLGKALTRYRTREIPLDKKQIERLAMVDDFLSRTEKNIQLLEQYYQTHQCLPLGEENVALVNIMGSYKSGKVPITKKQKERLEAIGVFLDSTERMIQAIENYYKTCGRTPGRGKKSPEGYDMGNAIIGYRTGKRQLTLEQKRRLEVMGIKLPNAVIKEEKSLAVRIVPPKSTLAEQIQELKKERETLMTSIKENRITKL